MVVGVGYMGSIPLTIRSYYRLKRTAEARKTELADIVPLPRPATAPLGEMTPSATEWRH